MILPVPAPGFTPTQWRMPDCGDLLLMVQFRSGYVDRRNAYTARQLRWSDTGHAWDVVAVKRWVDR